MSASTIFRRGTSFAVDRLKIYGKNRTRLIEDLRNKGKTSGLVLLQGGKAESACFFDTDMELLFRQEAFMHWAFGVETEDIVGVLDLDRSESALFVPRLPAEYAVWLGKVEPPSTFKEMYGVTEAGYLEDLERFVQARQPSTLYVLSGVNSDSGRPTYGFDVAAVLPSLSGAVQVDTATLYPSMVSLRRRKTPEEIEVMRYSSLACSHAHVAALRACKPGMMEFQLESLFLHVGYSTFGCRHSAYTSIVASGPNPAVLHYGHAGAPNSREMQAGDMVLCDMGLDYNRYASDITCTYPVNGTFTPEQRTIYRAVLEAHQSVIERCKPGVSWPEMHSLAYAILLRHLLAAGLVQGGSVEELMEAEIGGVFMPHGLGHFLGLDTHDVGGYLDAPIPRIPRPGFKSLRTTRNLEEGNVITVEPGCYFNDFLLDQARADPGRSKYLDFDVIERYRSVGGVRIEDNVVITADGCESMTKVPRTCEDIERVMAGGEWAFE